MVPPYRTDTLVGGWVVGQPITDPISGSSFDVSRFTFDPELDRKHLVNIFATTFLPGFSPSASGTWSRESIPSMRQVISVSLSPASSPGTSSGLKWRNLRRKVGVLKFSSSQTSRSLISMGNSCGEKERGLVGVTLYNCDHIFRQEEEVKSLLGGQRG